MDVSDDEADDEDCHSDSEHVQCPLLRVGANTVTVQDEILADGGEAVDPGPGEGDHDGQEHSGDHRDKDQDSLVTGRHHHSCAVVLDRQKGVNCWDWKETVTERTILEHSPCRAE